jgi:SHAQKYF class myb-like DNA-binding protein
VFLFFSSGYVLQHRRFLSAVDKCGGIDRALPKAVMHEMEITGLTRENVASHLQKYRLRKRKDEDDADLLHDGIDIPELHKHAASPALENDFVPHGAAVLGGSGRAPEKTPDAMPTAAGTPDDHNNSNTPVAAAAAAHRNYVSGEGEGAGAGRHAKRSKRALRSMPEAGTEAVNNAEGCRDS